VQNRFTPEEYARIDAAILEVERSTAADLDLIVTRVSDRYSLFPLVWASLTTILAACIFAILRPGIGARALMVMELIIMIVSTAIFDWMPIRLMLVPNRIKRTHARQLARLEFAAHNGGPDRRRILLFVSLGERYIEIIADRTTHHMATESAWSKIVDDFLATVKSGRISDGVLTAIQACGAVLAEYHPATGDDEAAQQ
jgi:putative membrane protein